uniref:NADH-ubiquinone oxidoreductase chain 1 n=1 Tax=Ardeacarus ardeae TaxID=1932962 RepID=A0A343BSI0_9ACAR|nr:NADH dehydrogenase subunit 1 [Ardeacarus ardeae]
MMLFYTMTMLLSLIGVLLSVAFFTLMERKIMGLMHFRKGPNKISVLGILQPMSDAMKLFTKESTKLQQSKMFLFYFGPSFSLLIMMVYWLNYESINSMFFNKMKIFLILSILSLSTFSFTFSSWGSNSKYSILGGYRAISQTISYEICLSIFLLTLFYTNKSFSVQKLFMMKESWSMLMVSLPLFLTWILLCLAELNRAPFDMSEGESEIVSGFNIEYGGSLFAFIFIAEYGMILFLSFFTSLMFLNKQFMLLKILLVGFIFILSRCSFPRMRYDALMFLCWKILLPYSLILLMFFLMLFF